MLEYPFCGTFYSQSIKGIIVWRSLQSDANSQKIFARLDFDDISTFPDALPEESLIFKYDLSFLLELINLRFYTIGFYWIGYLLSFAVYTENTQ